MIYSNRSINLWQSDVAILCYLSLTKLLIHFLTNGQYGYFFDEFYFIDDGEHLDWGFAEYPPLVSVLADISRWLLGDSLFAIRFFPAVAGSLTVLFTGLMVRELGGGRFAQCLAAFCVIVSPMYLWHHTVLTMNAFEPLIWLLCTYITILIVKHNSPKLWLLVGLMVGIGWLNKYSIIFFCFGLFVGLLITPNRQLLLNRWIWIAGLIAFTIALPNLIWQAIHGWPFIEIQKADQADYQVDFWISTINFTLQQIFQMHPLTFPIALAGFYHYFRDTEGRLYRFIGWLCIVVFGLLIILKSREIYYLAPIYPLLWAPGAIKVEKLIYYNRRRLKSIILAVLITGGIITMPASLPVLPLETFISYSRFSRYLLPIWEYPFMLEPKEVTAPFRWMLGWEETVATVAKVYHSLLPSEQAKCAILAWFYGDAGAIDVLGRTYDLPKSISGALNYYFWGPRKYSGKIVISVGGDLNYLKQLFNQVEQVAMITNEKVGKSSNTPIYLCRQIKIPLEQNWSSFRNSG